MAYFLYPRDKKSVDEVKKLIEDNFSKIGERDMAEIYSDDKKRLFQIFNLNKRGYKLQIGEGLEDLTVRVAELIKTDYVINSFKKQIPVSELRKGV